MPARLGPRRPPSWLRGVEGLGGCVEGPRPPAWTWTPGGGGWTERRGPAAEPGFLGVVRGSWTGGWARPGCAGGQRGRMPEPSAEGKNRGHLQEEARVWCVDVGWVCVCTCVQRALCS